MILGLIIMASHQQMAINPFDKERNKYIEAHQLHEQNYDMDFHHYMYLINQLQNYTIDLIEILATIMNDDDDDVYLV